MDIQQISCEHCGTLNEIVFKRSLFGAEYNPPCQECGSPIRKTKGSDYAASRGPLMLSNIPGRGLGVIAGQSFKEGETVERCPVYVLYAQNDANVFSAVRDLKLFPESGSGQGIDFTHVTLPWMEYNIRCLALGYAMLYNHEPAGRANVIYRPYVDPDTNRRFLDFYALRDIEEGEELTQTYTTNENLWFGYKSGDP